MSSFSLEKLMDEYDLEIDDIRWYKSFITSQELLSYSENVDDLVQLIWSGKLASRLYNMEEAYAEELQDQINRGVIDETGIREILADAYALKNKRSWNR
ncbi:MAG: hypothetical protein PQJ61_03515 [Spirochaetales bacterium]|uniref:Uncharacterized protein n=1 Tax=Candidatus Thalassospirochaeta sargassi TaxID=3119039 RepID=A0AAJ1IAQ5_9SPIO|nr:hypothetical protein [Spirochaetales bacterium]